MTVIRKINAVLESLLSLSISAKILKDKCVLHWHMTQNGFSARSAKPLTYMNMEENANTLKHW